MSTSTLDRDIGPDPEPTTTAATTAPIVDVVVPTHDEAATLDAHVRRLHDYLSNRFPFTWRITIADNGSTDDTPVIARALAAELPAMRVLVRARAGRGGALREAWTSSDATVVAYTDVDLSTDLDALLPLVAPLVSGHSDVVIGSRLTTGARIRRGVKREVISRCYNAILHLTLRTRVRDAQCGFKAMRADTARDVLPDVVDDGWFFDTELLVVAQRRGLRVVELPVDWTDDPDSRVRIVATAVADLRGVWRLLTRRSPADPRWVRPAVAVLLLATALLYLWGLGSNGWANDYYAAAVQAASHSWKAFFFGSSDAANLITVDKAPAFLWPMALSARLFGVNAWSILVPQALEGVAAVGVLYLAVKRWFGPAAGLLTGAVLALTPVAALMFRYDNPDALLTLLLTCAAYALVRAVERGSTRWIVAVGVLVGWAFLAKMLQALLVVPAFGVVYLVAAPVGLARRIWQLTLSGAAMVASAGWWVAIVELWPASSRPYIGGSRHNSVLDLIFGYNGFGRLTGNETGSVGGGPAGTTGRWGPTGVTRLFNADYGGQASWLLPAALVLLVALLVVAGRSDRADRTRAAALLWGGWLVVTGLAISLGEGIIHTYYTVVLGPAIGALVGVGAVVLWRHRSTTAARTALAAVIALTGWWAHVLLGRTPAWHPGLASLVLFASLACAVGVVASSLPRTPARVAGGVAAVAVVAGLAGPAAYTWATVGTPHSGALPTAGPAASAGLAAAPPFGRPPGGTFRANGATPPGPAPGRQFAGPIGGPGGILDATDPSSDVVETLVTDADRYTWVAATVSANQAAGYQLATDRPVMAIGGFNGTDPAPSLARFQALVAAGRVHWFIAGGRGGGPGGGAAIGDGGSASSAITEWVTTSFPSTTVGGVTLYDLSGTA